jgi:hypothetical protein
MFDSDFFWGAVGFLAFEVLRCYRRFSQGLQPLEHYRRYKFEAIGVIIMMALVAATTAAFFDANNDFRSFFYGLSILSILDAALGVRRVDGSTSTRVDDLVAIVNSNHSLLEYIKRYFSDK